MANRESRDPRKRDGFAGIQAGQYEVWWDESPNRPHLAGWYLEGDDGPFRSSRAAYIDAIK